jgi:hypothetical protein
MVRRPANEVDWRIDVFNEVRREYRVEPPTAEIGLCLGPYTKLVSIVPVEHAAAIHREGVHRQIEPLRGRPFSIDL